MEEEKQGERAEANVMDKEYIQSLHDQSKKYESKAKDIQKQFDAFRQGVYSQLGISSDGDLNEHLQQWKEKTNQSLLKAEVKFIGSDLGIIDPDAAFALMDREGLEISEDGGVKGIREALDILIQSKPYLVKEQAQEEEKTTSKGGQVFQQDGNKRITREDLKSMKPEQINQALASGELNHLLSR